MVLGNLSERTSVLKAIDEFDRVGRTAFLQKYGFGPSKKYWIRHKGRSYDSKAIAGAAHGHQHPADRVTSGRGL